MQSTCMLRLVDGDIESPYKIVPDTFCVSVFLYHCPSTTWRPRHGACCVMSYGLHLSTTPFLREQMTSQRCSGQGLRNLADWLKFSQWRLP